MYRVRPLNQQLVDYSKTNTFPFDPTEYLVKQGFVELLDFEILKVK